MIIWTLFVFAKSFNCRIRFFCLLFLSPSNKSISKAIRLSRINTFTPAFKSSFMSWKTSSHVLPYSLLKRKNLPSIQSSMRFAILFGTKYFPSPYWDSLRFSFPAATIWIHAFRICAGSSPLNNALGAPCCKKLHISVFKSEDFPDALPPESKVTSHSANPRSRRSISLIPVLIRGIDDKSTFWISPMQSHFLPNSGNSSFIW